ncbi:hypothetical protein D3C72_1856090 [compost metagenome]
MVVLRDQLADLGQPFGHHVVHAALVGRRQLLRQLADLQRRRAPDLAVVRTLVTLDQLEQAGLAGAVAADDAHPLAPGNLPRHLVQQRRGAVGEGHIGELEQGHGQRSPQEWPRILLAVCPHGA